MGGGSPSHRCGHPKGPWDRSGIPAYSLHDRVVACECSTAAFGVIDLIAQQNPETDAEFAPYGDARLADTLLLPCAAIKATEPGLVSCGLQAGLAPQESQESIAWLRELSQTLPRAARVFARNHADMTRDALRILKAPGISKEHVRCKRRDRAHSRMRHQGARRHTSLRGCADTLGQIVDTSGQFTVQGLQR